MKKKKIVIVIVIFRIEKIGYKDFDHILPFLYFLNKNKNIKFTAKVLIFDNKIFLKKNLDPRIKYLSKMKNVDLEFLYETNFISRISNFLNFKNNSRFAGYWNAFINKIYYFLLNYHNHEMINKKKIGYEFRNSNSPLIVTLHNNDSAQKIVSQIKKINKFSKWMVLPEGTVIGDNKMLLDNHLQKENLLSNNQNYNKVDFNLVVSFRDLKEAVFRGLEASKGHVIGSPRYCKEWLKIKSRLKLDGKDLKANKKYKVKVLFLIPKKHTNVFHEEVLRTIDFISSYKEIELILLNNNFSYPKIPSFIANRNNVRLYLTAKEYSTSKLIEWSDIVLHSGSGVVFESFMKKKITVLPRYLSCNTLISEKYNAGINLNNRDELRDLCNAAVKSIDSLKNKYKKETFSSNKKFINDFVNGKSKSVPKMIEKKFQKIVNNF